MNERILNLISCCFRYFFYSHISMAFGYYLLYRACGLRQWKIGQFMAIIEFRMLINLLNLEILKVFFGQESWYPLLWELTNLFHILVNIYLVRYFHGPPGKSLLACVLVEPFAIGCLMGAYTLAYWNTGVVYTMTGQPMDRRDGLVMLFFFPLCAVCTLALTPVLRFYRNYPFKHPRLLLFLALIGFLERSYINVFAALPYSTYHLTADLLLSLLVVLFGISIWLKRANLYKRLYVQQMHSAEMHLALLSEQAGEAMDSRIRLEKQIALIESLPQKEQTALIHSYLTELKLQYTAFLEKNYCKDPLVDALLCHQEIVCRELGISTEFFLQQYGRGSVEEQKIAVLLLLLFDGAIQSCRKSGMPGQISLSMALLKGQFFLELHYTGKQKLAKDSIRPILRQHNGMFSQKQTDNGRRVEILLEANSVLK